MIDVGPVEREQMLRNRQKALERIRFMSRRPVERGALSKQTLIHCANRIAAVDGESEAVGLIRGAVSAGVLESRQMLEKANELAKVQSLSRRVVASHRTIVERRIGEIRWKVDKSPEGILERLSMAAAQKPAALVRCGTGGLGVVEDARCVPKGAELLGVYDIRADARDMLDDIKEAMA